MTAKFQSYSRDLFWSLCASASNYEILRWSGYDDAYWWSTVANTDAFLIKTAKDGKRYRLNPATNEVTQEPTP